MAPRLKKGRETDWSGIFQHDLGHAKRLEFVEQATLALSFMNDTVDLSSLGIPEDDRFSTKYNSIGRNIRELYGKAFENRLKPKAVAYEGEYVEEQVSKICDCLWAFETAQKRGEHNLNAVVEAKHCVYNALWQGMAYWDSRIDLDLGNETFYNGMPIYESINLLDVVLDARALRYQYIDHLHIIRQMNKEIIESTFDIDLGILGEARTIFPDEHNLDRYKDANMVDVIETQYLKIEYDDLVNLPPSALQELQLPKELQYMFAKKLKLWIMKLKTSDPSKYNYLNYNDLTKNLSKQRKRTWGWYCQYHVNGRVLHTEDYYLGTQNTLTPIYFFPVNNSPYAFGIPYYLKDAVTLQMLVETQKARLMQKLLRRGAIYLGKATDDFKDAFANNEIGKLLEIGEIDIGEGKRLSDVLMFEDYGAYWTALFQYSAQLSSEIDRVFANSPAGQGEAPFAQASGKVVERLQIAGMVMFSTFRDAINTFLSDIFDKMLHLAAVSIPPSAMITIAAENDQQRTELIKSGEFLNRISKLNTQVTLDLTTAQESMLHRQIVAEIMMKTAVFLPEFLSELGFDESVKIAQSIEQKEMARNQALAVGTQIISDPILAKAWIPKLQEYEAHKALLEKSAKGQIK